jgi:hypothetical protein
MLLSIALLEATEIIPTQYSCALIIYHTKSVRIVRKQQPDNNRRVIEFKFTEEY